MARSHRGAFTLGPMSESRSALGGRILVSQAANLTSQYADIGRTFIHSAAQSIQCCIRRRSKTSKLNVINYKHEYALAHLNLPTASFINV